MPGCENILAVTASRSLCGFCVFGIRSWKPHACWFLEMNKLLKLLQQCSVERAGPIPWPGRSCDFTVLDIFWSSVTEHMYMYFYHFAFSCWKDTEIEHVCRPAVFWNCAQHEVVIPFHCFRITNRSHLQGSRCPSRTCLGSIQLAHTGCLLEDLTVTELL